MIEFICESCDDPTTSNMYEIQNPSYFDDTDLKRLKVCKPCAMVLSLQLGMMCGHAVIKHTWDSNE